MPANWDARLTRTIRLRDGARLITLRDAANYLVANFSTVRKDLGLERAIELLTSAAETGRKEDREAATFQMKLILDHAQRLKKNERPSRRRRT